MLITWNRTSKATITISSSGRRSHCSVWACDGLRFAKQAADCKHLDLRRDCHTCGFRPDGHKRRLFRRILTWSWVWKDVNLTQIKRKLCKFELRGSCSEKHFKMLISNRQFPAREGINVWAGLTHKVPSWDEGPCSFIYFSPWQIWPANGVNILTWFIFFSVERNPICSRSSADLTQSKQTKCLKTPSSDRVWAGSCCWNHLAHQIQVTCFWLSYRLHYRLCGRQMTSNSGNTVILLHKWTTKINTMKAGSMYTWAV